jgi:hypothetical protein
MLTAYQGIGALRENLMGKGQKTDMISKFLINPGFSWVWLSHLETLHLTVVVQIGVG